MLPLSRRVSSAAVACLVVWLAAATMALPTPLIDSAPSLTKRAPMTNVPEESVGGSVGPSLPLTEYGAVLDRIEAEWALAPESHGLSEEQQITDVRFLECVSL